MPHALNEMHTFKHGYFSQITRIKHIATNLRRNREIVNFTRTQKSGISTRDARTTNKQEEDSLSSLSLISSPHMRVSLCVLVLSLWLSLVSSAQGATSPTYTSYVCAV